MIGLFNVNFNFKEIVEIVAPRYEVYLLYFNSYMQIDKTD